MTFPAVATHALAVTALTTVLTNVTAAFTSQLDGGQRLFRSKVLKDCEVCALVNLLVLRDLLSELEHAVGAGELVGHAELFALKAWVASTGELPFEVG